MAMSSHNPMTTSSPTTTMDKEYASPKMGNSTEASHDPEKQAGSLPKEQSAAKVSAFKSLGLLDRFLAVWILLAMIIGVLLGNFVPETGPALQKGKFVGVSVPIGENPDN